MHFKRGITAFLLCIMVLAIAGFDYGYSVSASVLYWGSRGDTVSEVQRRLKQWGYYDGAVDGIYGSGTSQAVKEFQRKNGLTADGVVGDSTAAALGIQLTGGNTGTAARGGDTTSRDLELLAHAVYAEARGEPYLGQVAVAAVILNRVTNPKFPNTIAGVIYQPGAFTAVSDGQINLNPSSDARKASQDALNGWDPSYGAIYYYNPATAADPWIYSRPVHITIGKHVFAT